MLIIEIYYFFYFIKYPNNIPITDKSNPLFTLAQDALEKEKKEQQQDVTQKVSSSFCICLLNFF